MGFAKVQLYSKTKIRKVRRDDYNMGPSIFSVSEAVEKNHVLAFKGKWVGKDKETIIVNVYGPHKEEEKNGMWECLDNLMTYPNVDWVLGGDFNEVRYQSERLNTEFNERWAKYFNTFIENNRLVDIPLLGKRFTRISDNGKKFSKIDRFLVTDQFLELWGDVSALALDRHTSDHCPIILRDKNMDFGPKPFKLFDIWLESVEVENIITDAWRKEVEIEDLQIDVTVLEEKAKLNVLSDLEREASLDRRVRWLKKQKDESDMLRQKAKLKWAADRDKNTAYFHASIRRSYNKTSIRGLNINGIWDEKPSSIKREVFKYYSKLFMAKHSFKPNYDSLNTLHFNKITEHESNALEAPFSEKEIWDAISNCEPSKAPGPMVLT
ncbi:uncharacterized protein [Rutidosis leptorrhynchoides]|uniref:uncharacterized protein n=1 Tax=Rutidosis leptorrhynchoides TaxID=125765 RepID=UPI003A9A4673